MPILRLRRDAVQSEAQNVCARTLRSLSSSLFGSMNVSIFFPMSVLSCVSSWLRLADPPTKDYYQMLVRFRAFK
jgi:hypothetical protein